jgi:hypothetical protein
VDEQPSINSKSWNNKLGLRLIDLIERKYIMRDEEGEDV